MPLTHLHLGIIYARDDVLIREQSINLSGVKDSHSSLDRLTIANTNAALAKIMCFSSYHTCK